MFQATDSDSDLDLVSDSDVNWHSHCPSSLSSSHSGRSLQQKEEEEESADQKLVSFCFALPKLLSQWICPCFCKCLHWGHHAHELNCEGPMKFHEMCCMHCPSSFTELCSLIDPLTRKSNTTADTPRSGPITTEMHLHCCVHWLSQGIHNHICLLAGISKTSFCAHDHGCVDAINSIDALGFHIPQTPHKVEAAAGGFGPISLHNIMEGCVASVDGLLIETGASKNNKVEDVKAFSSGHCHAHGINMQVQSCL